MDKKIKKIVLTGFVILLIVINLSSLATIYFHKKVRDKKLEEFQYRQEQIHIRGMYRFLKDELQLNNSQFQLFQEINHSNMIKSQNIAEKLNKSRHYMMAEIAKPIPNQKKLDSYAKDIGDLHYELKKLSINHFMELKEICDEEQQEGLQKLFMQMIIDQDSGRNRRGNPPGRGRNRKPGVQD